MAHMSAGIIRPVIRKKNALPNMHQIMETNDTGLSSPACDFCELPSGWGVGGGLRWKVRCSWNGNIMLN